MKLSVIVPVYNGEKYLEECLSSLTRQGFKEGEHQVIVVNDGSTDGTEGIIDKFCSTYGYFLKVNKANGGVSSARNLGLQTAKEFNAQYLAFVDGDDMVADNCFSIIADICIRDNLDAFSYQTTKNLEELAKKQTQETFEENYAVKGKCPREYMWCVFYRASILFDNEIIFNEKLKYFEDTLFILEFNEHTKKTGFTSNNVYYYRDNPVSAMNSFKTKKDKITGDGRSVEYHWYMCGVLFEDKKSQLFEDHGREYSYTEEYLNNLKKVLSVSMHNKYNAKQTIKEISPKGRYRLRDKSLLKAPTFKGRLKNKFVYFLARNLWAYRFICWLYKIFK